MERVVTTLPTTVRKEMSTARIQGLITGGLLAHHVGAEFIPWMGLNGRSSDTSAEARRSFNAIALAHGPQKLTRVMNDTDPDFIQFVQENTAKLLEDGHLEVSEVEQLICECGIVHIEKSAVAETHIDRLQNIKRHLGTFACRHCESTLKLENSAQITTAPSLYSSLHASTDIFLQQSIRAKIRSIVKDAEQKRKIVSRTSRSKGIELRANYSTFILDPDFSLQFTPSYLPGNSETILISGSRQIERVMGSMAIFKALNIQSTPIPLLHPRITLHSSIPPLDSPARTSPREILESALLTACTLSWSNHESKLGEGDYKMLAKMTPQLSSMQTEQDNIARNTATHLSQDNSVTSFMRLYSPQRIREVLKAIRQGNISAGSDEAIFLSDLYKW